MHISLSTNATSYPTLKAREPYSVVCLGLSDHQNQTEGIEPHIPGKRMIFAGVEFVSIVTCTSADKLGLKKGEEVFAVIKSSSVMIAAG